MTYGIKIYRKDAPPYVLDSNSTMMCLDGVALNPKGNTGIRIPDRHDYFSFLSTPIKYFIRIVDNGEGDYKYVVSLEETEAILDENRVVNITIKEPDVNKPTYQQLVVLSWLKNDQASGYGISLAGINNFAGITQDTQVIPVIWKGDVEVTSNGWSVRDVNPSLSYSNCFVMFYCNDPSITIARETYTEVQGDIVLMPFNLDGSISKKIVKIKVVIFGIRLDKILHKNGIEIYSNKKIVYNSGEDILLNPRMIDFSIYNLDQFTTIPGVKRPLICCSSIGSEVKDKGGRFVDLFLVALRTDGEKVSGGIISNAGYRVSNPYTKRVITKQKFLVLDASDYFSFSNISISFTPNYISAPPDQNEVTLAYTVSPSNTPPVAYFFSVPVDNKNYVFIDKDKKQIVLKRNDLQLIYEIEAIDNNEKSTVGLLPVEFRVSSEINIIEIKFDPSSVIIQPYETALTKYEIVPPDADEKIIFEIPESNKSDVSVDEVNRKISLKYNLFKNFYIVRARGSRSNKIIGEFRVQSKPHYLIKINTGYNSEEQDTGILVSYKYPADINFTKCYFCDDFREGEITYMDGTKEAITMNKEYFTNKKGAYIKYYKYYCHNLWKNGDYIKLPCGY